MSQWVWRGMRTGVVTTPYPASLDVAAGVSPGLPLGGAYPTGDAEALAASCPTEALSARDGGIVVDYRRCVHCFRCARQVAAPLAWSRDYEWGAAVGGDAPGNRFGRSFDRSVHIIVVDAGDCGACLNEVRQLNNPYYNMHRLGFFLTPTPRHADVLLVVGPVTDQMQVALQKTYDAMPTPKRVVAVGACALSGGVFGPSFVSAGGVGQVLPVDVEVPGQPPPPLAILHGLLLAVGRAAPTSLISAAAARAPIAAP
jgi:Ni,Fe-hydrogenase III small subunit